MINEIYTRSFISQDIVISVIDYQKKIISFLLKSIIKPIIPKLLRQIAIHILYVADDIRWLSG